MTVTDHASRYLLLCEALESTCESLAFTAFQRLFQERGLPCSIRSDNGVPFASPNSLFQLSKLSVWWLRLGIRKKINLSTVFAGQAVGIKEVEEGIWLVSFLYGLRSWVH